MNARSRSPEPSSAAAMFCVITAGVAMVATAVTWSIRPDGPGADAGDERVATAAAVVAKPKADPDWITLFDGKSLDGWIRTQFGGEGDVYVEDGAIILESGNDLTGIHTERELPRINFEMQLEAQRVEGSDFFCGLTFPVRDDPCSLILGGWGGGLTGLSNIDGMDASENETTNYYDFENDRWYQVRIVVTETDIMAWIDDEQIIDQSIEGRRISVRFEVEPSQPLGIASYQTTAALRDIRVRPLADRDTLGSRSGSESKH